MKELFARLETEAKVFSLNNEKHSGHLSYDNQSAYLGPRLWDRKLSLNDVGEDAFNVMNIEEFLEENNIDISSEPELEERTSPPVPGSISSSTTRLLPPQSDLKTDKMPAPSSYGYTSPYLLSRPGVIINNNGEPKPEEMSPFSSLRFTACNHTPATAVNDIKFCPDDLALATVPGAEFDPRRRSFDLEELKPQPIIRKRPKIFVSSDSKDAKYWERRIKNNVAARRSREARRLKENQIALRAAFLEQENERLSDQLEQSRFNNSKLSMERDILKQKIAKYEQTLL